MSFVVIASVVVVIYNNVVNLWGPFHRGAYVPVNLAFAGGLALAAVTTLDLSVAELGLRGSVGHAVAPLAAVAIFSAGAFAIARSRHARLIADRRVAGLRGAGLAYYTAARIPLGTALVEELVFRGVLATAWVAAGYSHTVAATYASLAFGLWHIAPTIIGVRINDPDASVPKLGIAVVGGVVFTTAVGLGLTWLRFRTGSLIGPILLHAGVNSTGALAAVAAQRREATKSPASRASPGPSVS